MTLLFRLLRGLIVFGAAVWGALALHFDGPDPVWLREALAVGYAVLMALAGLARPAAAGSLARAALFGGVLAWWLSITPSNDRDWAPEYARLPAVTREGSRVTIRGIRDFAYHGSEAAATPRWYDATYDLDELESLDLVSSYWAGDAIAHILVSFGFRDGRHLAVSIETRRERGEGYSTLAGFFRQYELIYVVADERDLIGLRTDIRHERVYLYRVHLPPEALRALFLSYLDRIEALRTRPEFYNTLTDNCTTNILAHANTVAPGIAYSWKVLASGHAAEYAHDLGLLDSGMPFEALRRESRVRRPDGAVIGPDYSAAIRRGLP
ncbi:DUF4105 domain-containing protein [Roseomonas sp. NAR14]|uniref:DUF4105 domain-containing protein n=1 Tax=Roseomonas acroporae TaxID=2937791 RepID=A0A9X2BTR6_9PROT|nr:DUF4105 domain-containing protein [Roseomonas acroporae]MCK8784602.1 DUF4105 domain-containing protein [Roseomonas acroporae]